MQKGIFVKYLPNQEDNKRQKQNHKQKEFVEPAIHNYIFFNSEFFKFKFKKK